ncbi:MAG: transketolase [Acidobacteriia bacterium]|nr:transketolase [Terriglobia bacterium]
MTTVAHQPDPIDQLCINTIRTLAMDAVQKANSGHPGMPMGAAAMTYVLWDRFLRFNPANPKWTNRDRFILSCGHGCMLLYALLHLTGYDVPLDQIKQFRQLGSITPGHPEYGLTPGVEATTGPLGQGFANGVGMAMAERFLAATFNRPGFSIVDYTIYGIVSDGDLEEGISSEAASLAGHLGLGNLIYLYDDNHISIEGDTALAFNENVDARFAAYGWHVQSADGNNLEEVAKAITKAREVKDQPSLIRCRTHIAFGSPHKQDNASAHGSPLGEDEVRLTKRNLGWPEDAHFFIPDESLKRFRSALSRGAQLESEWKQLFDAYQKNFPAEAQQWKLMQEGKLPEGWDKNLPVFTGDSAPLATREASGKVINALADAIPWFIGGSADLAPSTDTLMKKSGDFEKGHPDSRNLHFGIREHAMGAIINGMALSRLVVYGATFLQFSDYQRPTLRLAALSEYPSIFVFTHDSIGLGEDGPTHQPVEHLAALRAIPHLTVIRPADATETVYAWKWAIENRTSPTVLVFTRQKLPVIDRQKFASAENLFKGAYILAESKGGPPEIILMATGSEVSLALDAWQQLTSRSIRARVVSMPSWELFEQQPAAYREEVLPRSLTARLAIEMASPMGWHQWVGDRGDMLCVDRFGASAPLQPLLEAFGFTVDNVVSRALKLLNRTGAGSPESGADKGKLP